MGGNTKIDSVWVTLLPKYKKETKLSKLITRRLQFRAHNMLLKPKTKLYEFSHIYFLWHFYNATKHLRQSVFAETVNG